VHEDFCQGRETTKDISAKKAHNPGGKFVTEGKGEVQQAEKMRENSKHGKRLPAPPLKDSVDSKKRERGPKNLYLGAQILEKDGQETRTALGEGGQYWVN